MSDKSRMDDVSFFLYFPAMAITKIPSWQLYGEQSPFPDLVHIETITERASGLDWRIAPHRHLHLHQIFLILSGEARLSVDGMTLHGHPPFLMNVPRGHVHGFDFSAGTQGFVLTLPASDFPEIFGPTAETRTALERAFVLSAGKVAPLFSTIAQHHAAQVPLRRLKLRAAAVMLCCAVAEAAGESLDGAARDGRIARFEELIRAHLADVWKLADYARALAMSERHLRRLCLATKGVSAHGFLEATRLREACRMLAYTRMRAQDVGFALGFDDPAYFARVFRRGMGMSVTEYRRRLEGADG